MTSISTFDPSSHTNSFVEAPGPAPEPEPEPESAASDHSPGASVSSVDGAALAERCKWIPLRLSSDERQLLSFLEGALHVSEYTDKVDVMSRYNLANRIIEQMEDFCAMHSGLMVCKSFKKGARVVAGDFKDNAEIFQLAFEVGRRYKIMNPQKMRADYGKLMFMLQDWAGREIVREIGFAALTPVMTVTSFLKARGALHILDSPALASATRDVGSSGMSSEETAALLADKRASIEAICKEFAGKDISQDDIVRCLDSIADVSPGTLPLCTPLCAKAVRALCAKLPAVHRRATTT